MRENCLTPPTKLADYHPLDTHYSMESSSFVPYYCGQTMLKWPWRPDQPIWRTCAVRGHVHQELDEKLVTRFIKSVQMAYPWEDVEITLLDKQLTCRWNKVPKIWQELYILLSLIRLPFEHPYALIQYQKIRKFLPRDVALAFCTCYTGYHINNHLLRFYVFQQQHLVDFSFETIIKQSKWEYGCSTAIHELYGPAYPGVTTNILLAYPEMTPEIYEFLLKQKGKTLEIQHDEFQKFVNHD